MTLQEWLDLDGQPYRRVDDPAKHAPAACIPDGSNLVDRWGLWHLTDYRVTSVTGGAIWLMPRKQVANG